MGTLKDNFKDMLARALAGCVSPRAAAFLCHEKYFRLWEERGIHITPVHFYQPLPDTRELDAYDWGRLSELPGVEMNAAGQLGLLQEFSAGYRSEYALLPRRDEGSGFCVDNGTFESVDAEVYYCFIRKFRPARVVEVGAGNSTLLAAQALQVNREKYGVPAELTVIEPNLSGKFKAALEGRAEVIGKKLEETDLSVFTRLRENDILFIDSSHVLKTGGDVQRLYLEILPRLNKGVLVHVHDIFLPGEYPKATLLERHRFWNEQYLVQAFLAFNGAFSVLWGGGFMHLNYPAELEAAFPSYSRGERRPGSLWLRKTA